MAVEPTRPLEVLWNVCSAVFGWKVAASTKVAYRKLQPWRGRNSQRFTRKRSERKNGIVRNLEERKFGTKCRSRCGVGHFSQFCVPRIAEK